ncbi:MAG TPA: single-stranded DNA-binding protein [bacterium]|nr:single-stranded DNA-binding protein [bacterium]
MAFNSFNKIMILGRLGRAPELKYSTAGNPITKFTVATNERLKGTGGQAEEHTEWHKVVVFGAAAENCSKFLKQGSLVFVEGKLRTRKYTDKDNVEKYFTEVISDTVHFLDAGGGEAGGGKEAPRGEERSYQKSGPKAKEAEFNSALSDAIKGAPDDDDLPF